MVSDTAEAKVEEEEEEWGEEKEEGVVEVEGVGGGRAPKATPTASPSGKLWMTMASIISNQTTPTAQLRGGQGRGGRMRREAAALAEVLAVRLRRGAGVGLQQRQLQGGVHALHAALPFATAGALDELGAGEGGEWGREGGGGEPLAWGGGRVEVPLRWEAG